MKTIVLTKLQHSEIEKTSKNKLQSFQRKIYCKAKENPKYKFYCLYDKVFRKDVIEEAWRRVKAKGGKGGVDGKEIKEIEKQEKEYLEEIKQELKTRKYKPNKLKRVEIPKRGGKRRVLRIPTIKDRVVQTAVKIVIEPIFEADFKSNSYGYRPKKKAQEAIGEIDKEMYREIYKREETRKTVEKIDIENCFDNIPHGELINEITKRIIDKEMIKIIKKMLMMKEEERKEREKKETKEENKDQEERRRGKGKRKRKGTPQGGVISPLLANIYLQRIEKYWEAKGNTSKLIRYADDCVIMLKKTEEKQYKIFLKELEEELQIKINREKTKKETIKEGINYLRFKLKEKIRTRNKKKYVSIEPSKESMKEVKRKIKEETRRQKTNKIEEIIGKVNIILRGWQEYFDNICMGKTREKIKRYAEKRLVKLINKRNKKQGSNWKGFRKAEIYKKYGLYEMKSKRRIFGK